MNRTASAASRHRRLARLVIAGALGCLSGTSAIGQSSGPPQLPTFRGGVRVIEVDAIVRDKDGNFIDNLTKDDFELFEDGNYQADVFTGSVLIGTHVDGANLKLARNDRIELSYIAIDRWGTTRAAERRAFTLTMNDQVRTRVAQSGLRLFGRLQLPRGQYQIRVVAHQPDGETGSVTTDVEVPDYTDMPLSVSELVVASANGPKLTTLEEDAQLRRALPSQPTPARRFQREDTLSLFAEVYDSHWILSEEIAVTSTVTAADGRLVSRQDQDLKSANHGRFYFTGALPLRGLEPGMYSVTVEAFTRAGVPASASQQLRFEVGDEP